jgi:hypothetical protein
LGGLWPSAKFLAWILAPYKDLKKAQKIEKIFCPKNAQIMPKSVPNEFLGGFYSYYADLSHSRPLMGSWLNHSFWAYFAWVPTLKPENRTFATS